MSDFKQQSRYWDHLTEQATTNTEVLQLIEAFSPDVLIQDRDVLDAGCGAGEYTAALSQSGAHSVTSFDVSVGRMQLAAHKSANGRFAQASLGALPYRSDTFDVIWVWGVLHYVPDPSTAFREITRTLRPGGVAIVHTLQPGFWSSLESISSKILGKTPGRLQSILLTVGVNAISIISRVITGYRPKAQTSKSVRQKLQEHLFVPANLAAFSFDDLVRGFGPSMVLRRVHPPVADLLKHNMSITVIARKRDSPGLRDTT